MKFKFNRNGFWREHDYIWLSLGELGDAKVTSPLGLIIAESIRATAKRQRRNWVETVGVLLAALRILGEIDPTTDEYDYVRSLTERQWQTLAPEWSPNENPEKYITDPGIVMSILRAIRERADLSEWRKIRQTAAEYVAEHKEKVIDGYIMRDTRAHSKEAARKDALAFYEERHPATAAMLENVE